MSAGDYEFHDGVRVRSNLTFAAAKKLFEQCRNPGACVKCEGKFVLWRVEKNRD